MVDMISGGRLILGVGAGYAPEEFAAFGYSLKERGSRLEESAALLHRLWTEENVTHLGKHYRVDNATVAPRPVQRPRPPIWFGAWAEPAIRRAARLGDAWFVGPSANLAEIAPCAELYRKACGETGKLQAKSRCFATFSWPTARMRRSARREVLLSKPSKGCTSAGRTRSSNGLRENSRSSGSQKTGLF